MLEMPSIKMDVEPEHWLQQMTCSLIIFPPISFFLTSEYLEDQEMIVMSQNSVFDLSKFGLEVSQTITEQVLFPTPFCSL